MITKYSWSDGKKTVSVYVELKGNGDHAALGLPGICGRSLTMTSGTWPACPTTSCWSPPPGPPGSRRRTRARPPLPHEAGLQVQVGERLDVPPALDAARPQHRLLKQCGHLQEQGQRGDPGQGG